MSYLSKLAQQLKPYVAGEQPQDRRYIKLNTNENPYPPSSAVIEAIRNFDVDKLRRYPDPTSKLLVKAIADNYGLEEDNVFLGNGSDEVLSMCFRAFFDEGDGIALNDLTYSFYPVYSDFYGLKPQIVKVNEDYTIDVKKYDGLNVKGIVIANPNAPTSVALKKEDILYLSESNPEKIIVVDEAYARFGKESVVDYIKDRKNIVVVKTFSKSHSLAGLRIGVALGDKPLIDGLKAVRDSINSYTVDALAQAVGLCAYQDKAYVNEAVNKVIKTREWLSKELKSRGYSFPESQTNFIFLEVGDGNKIYSQLKNTGILVRFFRNMPSKIRVTIGTDEEMKAFLDALDQIARK